MKKGVYITEGECTQNDKWGNIKSINDTRKKKKKQITG
jgi:hypothetical protein